MSFDGEGFVELANELYDYPLTDATPDFREAELRTSISRAYYGVFLKASTSFMK